MINVSNKSGKYGEFIFSKIGKNAPLIFIVGGKNVKGETPGSYMKRLGFSPGLNNFNMYNIEQTEGGGTSHLLKAWNECKSIMTNNGINPSKKILVGFSLGASLINSVVNKEGANYWDIVLSCGGFMPEKTSSAYTNSLTMINQLTSYDSNNKPISSRFVHIHAKPNSSKSEKNGDGQNISLTNNIKKLLPSENELQHDSASHMMTPVATSKWIGENISVNSDGSAQIKIQESSVKDYVPNTGKSEETNNISKPINPQNSKNNAPVTSESQKCETQSKNPAVFKSTKEPRDAGNIKTDAKPPSKNDKPNFSNSKYNHRFYIKPTSDETDFVSVQLDNKGELITKAKGENDILSNPAELKKMVQKSGPWYNRYWAYRLNSGPNYGFEKYETSISENKTELISAVIPYWPPPSDSKNPKDDAKVKGNWNRLIDDQLPIKSPIDIPILLNAHEVGVYNDNIGYIYEAENELHMTLLESEIINKGKLAIGQGLNDSDAFKKVPDSSWANYPRWSGIFTEHCLRNSGFTLQEKLSTNIDFYHRSILSKNKLVNHPGNKEMSWQEMKELGKKHRMFKPSSIWMDPKYLNEEEFLKDKDDGIAIFIVDYHIKRDGTLTERGKRLVKHINEVLKWPMATISAVPHHASNSTLCYTDVLLYMDETGAIVTLGGNTDIPDADVSTKPGNHISVKVTNFSKFAKATGTTYVNASVIVACIKSAPKNVQSYRMNKSLNSKLIASPIFDDYFGKITEQTETPDKISIKYYNKLAPYIVDPSVCMTGTLDEPSAMGPGTEPYGPEPVEPEYLPDDYEQQPGMETVSKDKCEQLRKKYNLSSINTNIPGISTKGVEQLIDNTNCKGGLTPLQVANLMASLAGSESSNRYNVKGGGSGNYSGRYQFGKLALIDVGYLKSGGNVNNPKSWTGKNGIKSREDFLNCPIVQELAMQDYIIKNYNFLHKAGNKIPKNKLDEMPCHQLAGLLAVSHLLGFGNAQKYYHSNGKSNGVDGFGMSAAKYFKLGASAAKGVFANTSLGRHPQNSGEKYFLYPGSLSNGLGIVSGN